MAYDFSEEKEVEDFISITNDLLPQQLGVAVQACGDKEQAFQAWKAFFKDGNEEKLCESISQMKVSPTLRVSLMQLGVHNFFETETRDEEKKTGIRGLWASASAGVDKLQMMFLLSQQAVQGARTEKKVDGLNATQSELYRLFVTTRKYFTCPEKNPSAKFRHHLMKEAAQSLAKSYPRFNDAVNAPVIAVGKSTWETIRTELRESAVTRVPMLKSTTSCKIPRPS